MTIVKRGSGFRVVSEKGKNLGDEPSKGAAVKRLGQIEWFKEHAKCIVDPSLVKGNEGMQQYSPIVFQDKKYKESKGDKLDFPSTTKQLELKDVKQPEFPSTPFTGEAFSQSFHNPRPSNGVKDGTHVIVQGDTPAAQQAGPFRGEHGPDVQFKGSDYVPDSVKQKARAANAKKSIMIAGRKVIIKSTQGSDNENLRNYPIDKGKGEPIDPRNESLKRKDWLRERRVKEDTKAYDDAKKNYAPGNGPYQLAMDAKTAYLGRTRDSKPIGEYTKEYPGAKVTFNQPIDPTRKPKKVFVHLTECARDVKAKRQASRSEAADKIGMKYDEGTKTLTKKSSNGIMRVILQYTQNQPLAAGFKPLLAHLVTTDDDDDEENLKGNKLLAKKAMTTEQVHEKIKRTTKNPIGPKLNKPVAPDNDTQEHDEAAPVHPGVDYKNLQPKSVVSLDDYKQHRRNTGSMKEKKPPEGNEPFDALVGAEGGSVDFPHGLDKPAKVLEFKKKEPKSALTDPRDTNMWSEKSNRPNPVEGGIGDKLDYKDVDENELDEGIKVEQEHVKNSDDDEDEKRVKGADIAMDHLEEDPKYYTHLKEMERNAKAENKADTQKKKLLKLGDVGKSIIKERKLTQTVANAEKMKDVRESTGASPSELRATHGQLRAYTAKLKAERKKNESITKALRKNERTPSSDPYKEYKYTEKVKRASEPRSKKARKEWEANAELEKLSEIKGKELDRKRY